MTDRYAVRVAPYRDRHTDDGIRNCTDNGKAIADGIRHIDACTIRADCQTGRAGPDRLRSHPRGLAG